MKVVIVEDEFFAADRLKKLLEESEPGIEIVNVLETVKKAVQWFGKNQNFDLIFMDIQLADGLSLEIFEQVEINKPVIFTTAYDEYALKAFQMNGIDYLLKPITHDSLNHSLEKLRMLRKEKTSPQLSLDKIKTIFQQNGQQYKTRFLVKTGQVMQPVNIDNIAYFITKNQLTYLVTKRGNKQMIDFTLDELETSLNPTKFFRVNRQIIISIDSIEKIHPYFSNRLLLEIKPEFTEDVIVSKRKVHDFKQWLQM